MNSGSKGNGYLVYDDSEALVLECGVPYSSALKALDFNRKKIAGALVSHEHGDHSKYVSQYLDAGIPVFTSAGTIEGLRNTSKFKPTPVKAREVFQVGGFKVLPFETQHDCREPLGFVIGHSGLGALLFATDTYFLRYKFNGLTQIMLECNYDVGILDKNVADGVVNKKVRDRVLTSHMSLANAVMTLKANDLSRVSNIILMHLSENNADPEKFRAEVEAETGKIVYVAEKGLDIDLSI